MNLGDLHFMMAHRKLHWLFLYRSLNCFRFIDRGNERIRFRRLLLSDSSCHYCTEYSQDEEQVMPFEWYEKAFHKLSKLSNLLKGMDLIDGKLVNIRGNNDSNNTRVFDKKLEEKMHIFKSLGRDFIGCPVLQEEMKKNVVTAFPNGECGLLTCFSKPSDRTRIVVNSLTKVSTIFNMSAQQRKLVRITICPQVTHHRIWIGALQGILNGLRSDIEFGMGNCPSKEIRISQQIIVSCLKLLDTAISYDPESTSWMRLSATKAVDSDCSHKWEDVLEMFNDLVNCLCDEKELVLHVTKLEIMKEGLYQIRDVLLDRNVGYKENRYQESLVQKKLTKTLGHSSRCLFTLLLYYLYGSVRDIEVEISGGVYPVSGGKQFWLCMGKFLTSDEEDMVLSAVKQLDKALGVFKFVWETANLQGDLKLQGHLWCVGAQNRSITYRGNTFLMHGIS